LMGLCEYCNMNANTNLKELFYVTQVESPLQLTQCQRLMNN